MDHISKDQIFLATVDYYWYLDLTNANRGSMPCNTLYSRGIALGEFGILNKRLPRYSDILRIG